MQKPILSKFCFIILLVLGSCVGQKQAGQADFNLFKGASKTNKPLQIKYSSSVSFNAKSYDIKGIIKTNAQNDVFIQGFSSVLGVEVFRALFINDSLVFIDKVNKKYFQGYVSEFRLLKNLPINACLLCDYIFGRSNCQFLYESNHWLIDTTVSNTLTQSIKALNAWDNSYVVRSSYDTGILKSYEVGNTSTKLNFEYNSFVPRGNLFKEVQITYNSDSKPINLYFNEVKKIKNTSFDIKIPGSYKNMFSL